MTHCNCWVVCRDGYMGVLSKCNWQRRIDLHCTICTGNVVVPPLTLSRTVHKLRVLQCRSRWCHVSGHFFFVALKVRKTCAMYEWLRTPFDRIMFCAGYSRGEEEALDCLSSPVDCVFIPSVTLVVRPTQGCSSLGSFVRLWYNELTQADTSVCWGE
jgi:hypothetical protein